MILIGLGGNLPSPQHGAPEATLAAALANLDAEGAVTIRRSRWYLSPPVPTSDQPMFVNGVALIRTALGPEPLLALLHRIETRLGRRRRVRWEARVIDLDLLAYEDRVLGTGGGRAPELPHPRLRERAFVLLPLAEVAPGWRHPATGESVEEMIQALAPEDIALVSPLDAP